MPYEPTLESLRSHPVPAWYEDAKLGIFIHWSVPSVPGFAPREVDINELLRTRYDDFLPLSPYSEWYENAIKFPWSPSARHHRETYGDRPYASFALDFIAALDHWKPAEWAAHFRRAGARYVVMVTKHHDGFCLWPSSIRNPKREGWNSSRNCVGDLAAAVRSEGMRFGIYYSGGIDWSFNPKPVRNLGEFMASVPRGDYPAYAEAQVRELIQDVRPDVLWNDIAWPTEERRLFQLFADYYRSVPEGLVNDRWLTPGWLLRALRIPPVRAVLNTLLKRAVRSSKRPFMPPRPPHFDTRTPEYVVFPSIRSEKWECVRGMDRSFGHNRNSRDEDFLSETDLIWALVDIVSKNGNLLLNVGPRGEDAAIPEVQLRRLAWLGDWLRQNGEAIHGTRPWTRAEGTTREGLPVRFTTKGARVYAILLGTPTGSTVTLENVSLAEGAQVQLLGRGRVPWTQLGSHVRIDLEPPLPRSPAHVLALELRGGV
ncbi:MAG: alpha-L-fucosidase [Myxococcota bacterium]